jgi:Ca-activated chloride channel homolog
MRRLVPIAAAALCAVLAARPLDRIGQALLWAGSPGAAALMFRDPAWRGAALYRAGRYAEAADTLARAPGTDAMYNRGNALARLGAYAGAIAAYDEALARDPHHADAAANRALVLSLVGPPPSVVTGRAGAAGAVEVGRDRDPPQAAPEENRAIGDGRIGVQEASVLAADESGHAAGQAKREARNAPGAEGQGGGSGSGPAQAGGSRTGEVQGERGPRERAAVRAEGERLQATSQWIATIPDDPRRNLRIRIAAERARREAAGIAVPGGDDPW